MNQRLLTMTSCDADQVIVTMEPCVGRSVHTPHVRHRLFPEIRAEGETPLDAAQNLLHKLTGALDAKGPDDWHHVDMEHALEDVRAFLDRATRGDEVGTRR
jgi:hypothetical protein